MINEHKNVDYVKIFKKENRLLKEIIYHNGLDLGGELPFKGHKFQKLGKNRNLKKITHDAELFVKAHKTFSKKRRSKDQSY